MRPSFARSGEADGLPGDVPAGPGTRVARARELSGRATRARRRRGGLDGDAMGGSRGSPGARRMNAFAIVYV